MFELIEQEIIKEQKKTTWRKEVVKPTIWMSVVACAFSILMVRIFSKLTWAEAFFTQLEIITIFLPVIVLINGLQAHSFAKTRGTIVGMRRLYEYEAMEMIRKCTGQE
jgi:hypothetical protein